MENKQVRVKHYVQNCDERTKYKNCKTKKQSQTVKTKIHKQR